MSTRSCTPVSLATLAERIGASVEGDADLEIRGVSTLQSAGPHDLTFFYDERHRDRIATSKAGAILIDANETGTFPMTRVNTPNPRLALAQVLDLLYPDAPRKPGVHPTAIVPDSCTVGADVHIGAYAVVGERVTLGDRVVLHPHAVVYDDASLGEGTEVHSHAVVREHVEIGAHCVLQNGAVVGGDGFGFAPREDGSWHLLRQVGAVRIGDDSEVHSNACVDRGALDDTVIGNGTKIDNLAQIGHGCQIGDHTLLCGQVGLAGSCVVGNHVILGGQVGVADHLRIGDKVRVGAQGGVIADIEEPGNYAGAPIASLRHTMLIHACLQKLPETSRTVRRLLKRVDALEGADDGATQTER